MAVLVGNAAADGEPYRGWFVGHFVPDGLRSTDQVEVKWGVHAAGEERRAWAASSQATTISLLVRGVIRLFFPDDQQHVLATPGDYAMWPPDVEHRWRVEQDDTVVLTIRWPSQPGDATELGP